MNYKNEHNFVNDLNFKKHPTLGVWCHRGGSLFSSKTGKKRTCFKLRNRKDGYLQLSLKKSSYLAHRIIAEAWIPNLENKPKINHKNGIKDDNRIENLEWVTQRENIIHARDVLGVKYSESGFKNPNSRVNPKEIRIINKLYKFGLSWKDIADCLEYNIVTVRRYLGKDSMG